MPNWIGDAVVSAAFVEVCAEAHPGSSLTVMAHPRVATLFEHDPNVQSIIKLSPERSLWQTAKKLTKEKFDIAYILPISFSSALIVFLSGIPKRVGYSAEARGFLLTERLKYNQNDFRSRHIILDFMKLLGREDVGAGPKIYIQVEELKQAEQFLASNNFPAGKIIGFGPGATFGPAKRWPQVNWVELGRKITDNGFRILVFGSSDESALCQEIANGIGAKALNLAGTATLRQSAALLSLCPNFITNDTGVMHLAAAVGTKVTAIFGSTNPVWTRPWGEKHRVIYMNESCSPCYQRECRYRHYDCLKKIRVSDVHEIL
ncbi:lipopolysaccharide heptosyltransferase II [candidate division TA06 bacterium]|uniref:lipopolysaccharide heptosyltransferase II n=1 Tax=candidate division TA06 bacterium TaxID=2250710 RepID=A0A933MKW8_UNCT6|nr:lipopolysaccharide heptosyltransferase II [candidate division TA06 bacterium]